LGQAARIGDAKLLGQMACDPAGDSGRLVQERAEKSNGAELDGEPEPHVIPTLGAGKLAIGIVEVEMPRELLRARFAGISAIASLLFGGQERDRHPLSRDA
jgi:hypothetical protein